MGAAVVVALDCIEVSTVAVLKAVLKSQLVIVEVILHVTVLKARFVVSSCSSCPQKCSRSTSWPSR